MQHGTGDQIIPLSQREGLEAHSSINKQHSDGGLDSDTEIGKEEIKHTVFDKRSGCILVHCFSVTTWESLHPDMLAATNC